MGFQLVHRNIRFEGIGTRAAADNDDMLVADVIIRASEVQFDILEEYDAFHFIAKRGNFLKKWIRQKRSASFSKLDGDGSIIGYGVIRKCVIGHKIGPLFADNLSLQKRYVTL